MIRDIIKDIMSKFKYILTYPKNGIARYQVDEYMNSMVATTIPGQYVLDIGAGYQPYRDMFSDCKYESCDYQPIMNEIGEVPCEQTFYCDITKGIPQLDNKYDLIICNEVLEHVNKPLNVLNEIYRVLKPDGKLLLTTTQCFGLHQEPHNYYNFTKYGLKYLLSESGFETLSIEPLGGIFHLLIKVTGNSFTLLLNSMPRIFKLLLLPIEILLILFNFLLSYIYFHLDKFDKEKKWTINYGCYCRKPNAS